MILDDAKIKTLKRGATGALVTILEEQRAKMDAVVAQQEEQNKRLEKLTLTLIEALGVFRSSSENNNGEIGEQMSRAINQLATISANTMVSLSKVSKDIVENTLGKDGLAELAQIIAMSNRRSAWAFKINRDSNGRMTSVEAKEIKT